MNQRERIEQLNLQAHKSASSNEDEYVVEEFIVSEKLPVLVHQLIAIETWKSKVLPLIFREMAESMKSSMKPYLIVSLIIF